MMKFRKSVSFEHVECASEIPALGMHVINSIGMVAKKEWRLCLVREAWSWQCSVWQVGLGEGLTCG